jgi:hypothetical protein
MQSQISPLMDLKDVLSRTSAAETAEEGWKKAFAPAQQGRPVFLRYRRHPPSYNKPERPSQRRSIYTTPEKPQRLRAKSLQVGVEEAY